MIHGFMTFISRELIGTYFSELRVQPLSSRSSIYAAILCQLVTKHHEERERDRDRERQTDRQIDRNRERDRRTDRERDRERYRERERDTERERERELLQCRIDH
jgi:hypothetical protein